MKFNLLLLPILLFSPAPFCQAQQATLKPYRLQTGHIIYPKTIAKLIAPNMPKANGYVYTYQTEIKIGDISDLQQEAKDVWQEFKSNFEQLPGINLAIIQADQKPSGIFVQEYKSYRSVIERKPDGSWQWIQDKQKVRPPAP